MIAMRALSALALGAAVAACGADVDPSSGGASTADDEIAVAARCDREYGGKLRAKIAAARERLVAHDTPFARVVREALDAGRVEPLPFCKMTRSDFDELAKDTDVSALGATRDEQYAALRRAEAPGMRSLHAQLYGYQWETRIYLAPGVSDARMLASLAHETIHVLRRAHERNYDDQRVVCVEELEAYKAERLVLKAELTAAEIDALRSEVQDLYELDKLRDGACTYR
ncbi:MAG: hypothetical protein KF819_01630 [Labilithrix sp.]|nr:hypothetical protein [Labilithrix sp.]